MTQKIWKILTFMFVLAASFGAISKEMPADTKAAIPYWEADSPTMAAITEYVSALTDPASPSYVEPCDRIVVFDSDGTLYGELFPTYFEQWIPSDRIIGSTFSLEATGQGDTDGRKYTYAADDEVLLEGNLTFKTQKMNKVVTIVNNIGKASVLVFGNSSGDLAMGEYCVQHGGKAFMLLCDDTERDYGKPEVAEEFKEDCEKRGFGTVSMRDEFETIYGEDVVRSDKKKAPALRPVTRPDREEEAVSSGMKKGKALKAGDCIGCRSCEPNCPFGVRIADQMEKTAELFGC